ncbi:hypothetical protein ERJ75_000241900 [Trypanosoma vivax]|uniref:BAG domain-containing protein n=1 Tax=Trypanosoma vivax (strain Y486) TaxID=1055687 RepID=G0TY04_TRYVY|nr:hypothetical protein TRVL_04543 [Trypanosoma vivax]KAH8618811.1 hypothetical protein ERJ75_000241900 [Trypanosoma vivax]CCC48849.1 conserved hypothetical protein [Trypanosoma vivax Y486]
MDHVRARIRSSRGEIIDLALPSACKTGSLVQFLISEYDYPLGTQLMYGPSIVDGDRCVEEFPFGSLVIAAPDTLGHLTQPVQSYQPASSCLHRFQENMRSYSSPDRPKLGSSPPHQRLPTQTRPSLSIPPQRDCGKGFVGVKPPSPLRSPSRCAAIDKTEQTNIFEKSGIGDTHTPEPYHSTRAAMVAPVENCCTFARKHPHCSTINEEQSCRPDCAPLPVPVAAGAVNDTVCREQTENRQTPASHAVSMDSGMQSRESKPEEVKEQVQVRCVSPVIARSIVLSMAEDSTLEDVLVSVVAEEPRLAGCKIVFGGRVLSKTNMNLLSLARSSASCAGLVPHNPRKEGVYTLYFAPNEPGGVQKAILTEIESSLECIARVVGSEELSLTQRQGYYEELMRILFRTDELQELENEWRTRRKALVKRATELQDTLRIEDRK